MLNTNNNIISADTYDVRNDEAFKKCIRIKKNKLNISPITEENYVGIANHYCRAVGKTLNSIIEEIKPLQNPRILEDNSILIYDPNDSVINDYQNMFVEYMEDRGNSNQTINTKIKGIRTILKTLGIKQPDIIKLPVDNSDWNALSKSDVQFIFNHCSLQYKAFTSFLVSTGFRVHDTTLEFTIGDFIDATFDQHGIKNLDEFLEASPQDLQGFWTKIPNKTKRFSLKCRVYNSPESSNLIIESLKQRVKWIERLNKEKGTDFKLKKSDALFGSRNKQHKGHKSKKTVMEYYADRNVEFKEYKLLELKNKLNNGEIDEEEYDEAIKKIPRVKAHNFRKYFCTEIARWAETSTRAVMEAHATPLATDKHYIKALDEDIERIYTQALPRLTICNDEDSISKDKFEEIIAERDKKHAKELEEFQNKLDEERQNSKETLQREKEYYKEIIQNLKDEHKQDIENERKRTQEVLEKQNQKIIKIEQSLNKNELYNGDIGMDIMEYIVKNNIHDKYFEFKLEEFISKQVDNGNYNKEKIPQWAEQVKTIITLDSEGRKLFEESVQQESKISKTKLKNKQQNLLLLSEICEPLNLSDEMYDKIDFYVSIQSNEEEIMTEEQIKQIIIKVMSEDIDDDINI